LIFLGRVWAKGPVGRLALGVGAFALGDGLGKCEREEAFRVKGVGRDWRDRVLWGEACTCFFCFRDSCIVFRYRDLACMQLRDCTFSRNNIDLFFYNSIFISELDVNESRRGMEHYSLGSSSFRGF